MTYTDEAPFESPSQIGMDIESRRRKLQRPHRVVPVSLALDEERDGVPAWRCAHCDARRRFPDEFDDFDCCAIPLPLEGLT